MLEVYDAIRPANRDESLHQHAVLLWSFPERWQCCIEEATSGDPLAWYSLKALLRLLIHARREGARVPQSKDDLQRLQMWGLEVVAGFHDPPKGTVVNLFASRNLAIALTLKRLEKPLRTDGMYLSTSRQILSAEERATTTGFGLVGGRLGLDYESIKKVWGKWLKAGEPDADRWQHIEGLAVSTAKILVDATKMAEQLGLQPPNGLEMTHIGLYGRPRPD